VNFFNRKNVGNVCTGNVCVLKQLHIQIAAIWG
jgi:hypothetical protein